MMQREWEVHSSSSGPVGGRREKRGQGPGWGAGELQRSREGQEFCRDEATSPCIPAEAARVWGSPPSGSSYMAQVSDNGPNRAALLASRHLNFVSW